VIAILISGGVALLAALVGTPLVIRYFRGRGFGQMIREEGPEAHQAKAGTPTMGGTAIVAAAVVGWLVAHLGSLDFTPAGLLVMATFVSMAVVGFADDFIKVRMRRNLGLNKTAKFVGQGLIAAAFATFGPLAGIPRNISVTGELAIDLSAAAFFVWIFLLLAGTSNAVNLTDGLDGLAAGSSTLVFGAYTLITFWQFRNPAAFGITSTSDPLELAVIAMATMGAAAGFLWHNAPPAAIFMGDTGSLALGGLLAALAVATNTQVLLVLLGALFVAETVSVIIQVFAYRVFGTRVFRMTPIHHHFELVGWAETTIMVRFWIVQAIGIAAALAVFYAESLPRVVGGG
jgi:phospho-N-acetylmuramoyl-pentapeptide-transferase